MGPESWPVVSAKAWRLTDSADEPNISPDFVSLLKTEFPIRIEPVVAQWFNELDLAHYATTIENNFQDSWTPSSDSSINSTRRSLFRSREVSEAPTEFVPHESCACFSRYSRSRYTYGFGSSLIQLEALIKALAYERASETLPVKLQYPYTRQSLSSWVLELAESNVFRRASCDLDNKGGQYLLSLIAWVSLSMGTSMIATNVCALVSFF